MVFFETGVVRALAEVGEGCPEDGQVVEVSHTEIVENWGLLGLLQACYHSTGLLQVSTKYILDEIFTYY